MKSPREGRWAERWEEEISGLRWQHVKSEVVSKRQQRELKSGQGGREWGRPRAWSSASTTTGSSNKTRAENWSLELSTCTLRDLDKSSFSEVLEAVLLVSPGLKKISTPMLIMAPAWKQSKCSPVGEWTVDKNKLDESQKTLCWKTKMKEYIRYDPPYMKF